MTPLDGVGGSPSVVRRAVLWTLLGALAVVLLIAVWVVVDVLRVRAALSDARTQANDLAEQLKVYGPGGEKAIAGQLKKDVDRARDITDGPAWAIGKHLPVFGGDRSTASAWLLSSQPALAGAVPLQLARTELGAREVEQALAKLKTA